MSEKINKNEKIDLFDDERDLLLDHNYDGIRELDNHMPTWWLIGFWGCILFGVLYLLFYHVLGWGPSSEKEYQEEMAAAAKIKPVIKVEQEDWTHLVYLSEPESIEKGKVLYNQICNVCHGSNGEGLVGPNLTDEFWINGCDLPSVMGSIKSGFAAKGMPPYGGGKALDTDELVMLSSYINSLRGSKPSNAKPIDQSRELVCD